MSATKSSYPSSAAATGEWLLPRLLFAFGAQVYTCLAISELSVHFSGFNFTHETLLDDALQKGEALKVLP